MTDLSRRATANLVAEVVASEPAIAWDAYAVWRDRVRHSARAQVQPPAPPQGWDPYFVWLSRVKKSSER